MHATTPRAPAFDRRTVKLLVVSAWAPPMIGGGPLLLSKLLRALPPESYMLLTAEQSRFLGKQGAWLGAIYHFLGDQHAYRPAGNVEPTATAPFGRLAATRLRWLPFAHAMRDIRDLTIRSRSVRRQAIQLIREHQPIEVVATSDDGVFLLGAYQAAKATHTDLTVLLFDVYAGNNFSLVKRIAARRLERRILRFAKTVIVTNEKTRAHYARSYGIDAVVLPHIATSPDGDRYRRAQGQSIVYAGSVYWAQRDAVQDLVSALRYLPEARLTLLTDASETEMRRVRGHSTQVQARWVAADEVAAWYARADVLFLPLSFGNDARDVIRTASPGKLAEYLAAGVPILVHAPPDSFIAEDAARHGWGLVVDTPGESGLRAALRSLFTDDDLRRRLVTNALEILRTRHDERIVGERFRDVFARH